MSGHSSSSMNRREAIQRTLAAAAGVAFVASGGVVACTGERRPVSTTALGADDRALMAEVADTLLPTTAAAPGAKAAGAGEAIDLLLTDCYDAEAQRKLVRGLGELRSRCRTECAAGFASLPQAERERLLRAVDAEAKQAGDAHWFHLARELSLRAYFSSEVGLTKALRWVPVPGRWQGCVPLAPGQPAWG
jgi:hypothetical protein